MFKWLTKERQTVESDKIQILLEYSDTGMCCLGLVAHCNSRVEQLPTETLSEKLIIWPFQGRCANSCCALTAETRAQQMVKSRGQSSVCHEGIRHLPKELDF